MCLYSKNLDKYLKQKFYIVHVIDITVSIGMMSPTHLKFSKSQERIICVFSLNLLPWLMNSLASFPS